MKSDVVSTKVLMSKNDLKELSKETHETLAENVSVIDNKRVFGAIDLWNAQKRQKPTFASRRWLLN